MENHLTPYQSVIPGIKSIISSGQEAAYNASNKAMLLTYQNIGKRTVEQELNGSERAEYGRDLISALADDLIKEFGKNYSKRNLYYYIGFYQCFPGEQIVSACVHNPNWTHIRSLLRATDGNARYWYVKETVDESWSSGILDRNISTQYYHRLLRTPKKDAVTGEMEQKTTESQKSQFELIKSPVITGFLGLKNEGAYLEGELESAIFSYIKDFLMKLSRGLTLVARQQHIVTETSGYYLDLVFYNIELRCYVLVDLRMGRVTRQDVEQIDVYIRMYDDLKRGYGDNPTIGILLYSETGEDIARYSVLHDSDRLFTSRYLAYLPAKEQSKAETECQKEIFSMQRSDF